MDAWQKDLMDTYFEIRKANIFLQRVRDEAESVSWSLWWIKWLLVAILIRLLLLR